MIFMKKTMRFLALILSVAILALSFAGCTGGNSYSPEDQVEWISEGFKDAFFEAVENENDAVMRYDSNGYLVPIEISDQPTYGDLAKVEYISFAFVEGEEVAKFDLRDIEKFPNLKYLGILNSENLDLSPLKAMTKLEHLYLYSCKGISDLSPIAKLTNLKDFTISYTEVSDLSPLSKLTKLETLVLSNTRVSDLSSIAKLTNLSALSISGNEISNLSPIAGLVNLERLSLYSCEEISDLSPIAGLVNLHNLFLYSCTEVSDLSPIAGLTNLNDLNISATAVSDLSPLSGLINLESLDVSNTEVSDLSPLAGLTNLYHLSAEETKVADWSPVAHVPSVAKY
jgi:internalin A